MVFTIRNLFMKPVSAVLRERLGAFIMATNMTNSEAMVTSAAPYTTESKQTYPQGMSEARHGAADLIWINWHEEVEVIGNIYDQPEPISKAATSKYIYEDNFR